MIELHSQWLRIFELNKTVNYGIGSFLPRAYFPKSWTVPFRKKSSNKFKGDRTHLLQLPVKKLQKSSSLLRRNKYPYRVHKGHTEALLTQPETHHFCWLQVASPAYVICILKSNHNVGRTEIIRTFINSKLSLQRCQNPDDIELHIACKYQLEIGSYFTI